MVSPPLGHHCVWKYLINQLKQPNFCLLLTSQSSSPLKSEPTSSASQLSLKLPGHTAPAGRSASFTQVVVPMVWSNCAVLEVKVPVKNVVLVFSDAFGIELILTNGSATVPWHNFLTETLILPEQTRHPRILCSSRCWTRSWGTKTPPSSRSEWRSARRTRTECWTG